MMSDVKETAPVKFRKERSKILYQITIIMIVIMIISGLIIFFTINESIKNLTQKSIDDIVGSKITTIASGNSYIIDEYAGPYFRAKVQNMDVNTALESVRTKQLMPFQEEVCDYEQREVDKGLFNTKYFMTISPPNIISPKALVNSCNDKSLVYNLDPPDYLLEAMEEGETYILKRDGIPELGLEDEWLILLQKIDDVTAYGFEIPAFYVSFIPMHDEITTISAFYNNEKSKITFIMAGVIGGAIIAMILIIFFVLSHLIHKNITRPVEELSAIAEEVMEGNLDVKVDIHEGEELEGLKRAFNEMVKSIRKLVIRSIE